RRGSRDSGWGRLFRMPVGPARSCEAGDAIHRVPRTDICRSRALRGLRSLRFRRHTTRMHAAEFGIYGDTKVACLATRFARRLEPLLKNASPIDWWSGVRAGSRPMGGHHAENLQDLRAWIPSRPRLRAAGPRTGHARCGQWGDRPAGGICEAYAASGPAL